MHQLYSSTSNLQTIFKIVIQWKKKQQKTGAETVKEL